MTIGAIRQARTPGIGLFDRPTQILHEQEQVEWVGGRRLELGDVTTGFTCWGTRL